MANFEEKLKTLETNSKINLTDTEKETALEFLKSFIQKFDMLEKIDTENIEPLVTVSSLINVMREDKAYKIIDKETLLESAPEQHNGYFTVPRILE